MKRKFPREIKTYRQKEGFRGRDIVHLPTAAAHEMDRRPVFASRPESPADR